MHKDGWPGCHLVHTLLLQLTGEMEPWSVTSSWRLSLRFRGNYDRRGLVTFRCKMPLFPLLRRAVGRRAQTLRGSFLDGKVDVLYTSSLLCHLCVHLANRHTRITTIFFSLSLLLKIDAPPLYMLIKVSSQFLCSSPPIRANPFLSLIRK